MPDTPVEPAPESVPEQTEPPSPPQLVQHDAPLMPKPSATVEPFESGGGAPAPEAPPKKSHLARNIMLLFLLVVAVLVVFFVLIAHSIVRNIGH